MTIVTAGQGAKGAFLRIGMGHKSEFYFNLNMLMECWNIRVLELKKKEQSNREKQAVSFFIIVFSPRCP